MRSTEFTARDLRRIRCVFYVPSHEAVRVGQHVFYAGEAHAALADLSELTADKREYLVQTYRANYGHKLSDDEVIAWLKERASLLVN